MKTLIRAGSIPALLIALCWGHAAGDGGKPATIQIVDQHLDLLSGGKLIGRYNFEPTLAKPHFHPLNDPNGNLLTRTFPMVKDVPSEAKDRDHIHHRGVWFCHGDVIPEGMPLKRKVRGVDGVDFWSESPGHGKIVCLAAKSDGAARVVTQNEWRTADDEKVMDEMRTITLHDLGAAKLIVFDIDLLASVVPITFGDTKEGSFAIRISPTIAVKNKKGVLENAEGTRQEQDKRENGEVVAKGYWGRKSSWCDYSGPIEEKSVGLAIFDHPKNQYPAYWHARGYGLMAANPFGRVKAGFPDAKGSKELVKLNKGEHLKLRYGLLIHSGDAKEGKVAEAYKTFAALP